MSSPQSIIEAQLQNMVETVNTYRDERCARLHEQAHEDARMIIKEAFAEARKHVHSSIRAGRERMQRKMTMAKAKIKAEQRFHSHQRDQEFLVMAWTSLHNELLSRWENDDSRDQWLRAVIRQAGRVLPAGNWRVEYPAGLPSQTLQLLQQEIQSACNGEPTILPEASIAAGIRIESESAWVDGTLDGLLADRDRLSAELLALQQAQLGMSK